MLLNYIKIAFRNLQRNKLHTIINIAGLAIGMACAILLLLIAWNVLTYDRHHSKHERIYMVQSKFSFPDRETFDYGSYFPTGPALKDEYPAIEESVRLYVSGRIYFIDQKKEIIGEDNIRYADPEVFKVFDHKFIYGSPEGALDSPKSIVLNRTLAQKYFGEKNPVGKILSRNNGIDYTVTGVFEDLPQNSFMRYNALIPMADLANVVGEETIDSRKSCAFFNSTGLCYTYILLKENTRIESITNDFERFRRKYIAECGEKINSDFKPVFQQLTDVYLYFNTSPQIPPGALLMLYVVSSLAFLILIIGCINYMNLSTARSEGRAREVGIRKVLGAYRITLIRQFICESVIMTFIAFLLSLMLVELLIPSINNLFYLELSFSKIVEPKVFAGLVIFALFVGLAAGSYPAFFMSSFLPVRALKGKIQFGKGKGILRKILVIIQFAISITVIITTLAVQEQMTFIHRMDLGFNKDDVIIISPDDPEAVKSISAFKKEILGNNDIIAVSRSLSSISQSSCNTLMKIEDSKGDFIDKQTSFTNVDYDFIDMLEMKIVMGRSFSIDMGSDSREAFLVNETFIKEMGWTDSPIGKHIKGNKREGKVIGVLKDFYFFSVQQKIMPMVINLEDRSKIDTLPVTYIKIRKGKLNSALGFLKKKWIDLNPMHPFENTLLSERIDNQYLAVKIGSILYRDTSIISIFISCLGLFGLSSFIAEKKTKEIGIRKVNGASIWNIFYRLSYDFIKLILVAGIIAWPIAFFLIKMMLQGFAYQTEIKLWVYVIAICLALAIALVTVSYHAVKAALTDPVKTLRYE